jgi:hypothetical protein
MKGETPMDFLQGLFRCFTIVTDLGRPGFLLGGTLLLLYPSH